MLCFVGKTIIGILNILPSELHWKTEKKKKLMFVKHCQDKVEKKPTNFSIVKFRLYLQLLVWGQF